MRNAEALLERTKAFALRIIELCTNSGMRGPATILIKQLIRSGTSVGAQYREARRARSRAEFVSKLESAQQEMEETLYWMELLDESGLVRREKLEALKREASELAAMLAAPATTAKLKS